MYRVGDKTFDSFMEAVRFAQPIRGEVYEIATGLRRWAPPVKIPHFGTKKHVLVNEDGTQTEFSRVKR